MEHSRVDQAYLYFPMMYLSRMLRYILMLRTLDEYFLIKSKYRR